MGWAELEARLAAVSRAPVAVAVSGGGDSLALLRLVTHWACSRGRRVLALTVDHGLHPQSAAWTAEAGRAARARGSDWRALLWSGAKPSAGLASAARRARHALLAQAAREAGASVLLMGHTADDRREDEILRAGAAPSIGALRSFAPSPVWPDGRDVFVLRPLLTARRAELRAWLTAAGDAWRDDPANEDLCSPRVRARRSDWIEPQPLLPPRGEATPPPNAADATRGMLRWTPDALATLSDAGLRRLLACAAVCVGGGERLPRVPAVDRVLAAIRDGRPCALTLVGSRIALDANALSVTREARARASSGARPDVALAVGEDVVWDGRWALTAKTPGWSVGFARGRTARLSPATRRALRALPPAARMSLPVLLHADGQILAPTFESAPVGLRDLAAARFAAAVGRVDAEPVSL